MGPAVILVHVGIFCALGMIVPRRTPVALFLILVLIIGTIVTYQIESYMGWDSSRYSSSDPCDYSRYCIP
jgi:hypothetical protein